MIDEKYFLSLMLLQAGMRGIARNRDMYYTTKDLTCILVGISIGPLLICSGGILPPKVNVQNIRLIQLGMSREQVISILGDPFFIEKKDEKYFGSNADTMHYSLKPAYLSCWYPMLWVHLKDDKVVEVCAKRYILWGVDDIGVYGLTDDSHWEGQLESTFLK